MKLILNRAPAVLALVGFVAAYAGSTHAEVTLNAGARLSHDNNVNGSPDTPNKANQRSDNYLTLNASAVYFTPLNDERTNYFIGQAGVSRTDYNKFTNLDSTMFVASLGLWRQLSETWSGQVTGRGFGRDTQQGDRNSTGYGVTFELKKQMTETLWLKGIVDYEDSKANLQTFSNSGPSYGLNLGYLPYKDTFINLGYNRATRDFKSVAPFSSKSDTLFLEGTQRLSKDWYLSGGYAHMKNTSNVAGTGYTNHILSLGLGFSY